MTHLTREHHDLTAVMRLVRNEVGEDMRNVERQIAPDVGLRRRHLAPSRDPELEQRFDPFAAPLER